MPSRQRYVVLGVLALAALVGLALAHGLGWTCDQFGWPNPPLFGVRELPTSDVLGYAIALTAGIVVLRQQTSRTLANEIVDELARVTWPSREETGNATLVVIVAVVACSAYLGIFDAAWLWMTNFILGVQGGAAAG